MQAEPAAGLGRRYLPLGGKEPGPKTQKAPYDIPPERVRKGLSVPSVTFFIERNVNDDAVIRFIMQMFCASPVLVSE